MESFAEKRLLSPSRFVHRGENEVTELDRAAFGLEADFAGLHFGFGRPVDDLAVENDDEKSFVGQRFDRVPLARLGFGSFDALDAAHGTDLGVRIVRVTIFRTFDSHSVEAPQIARTVVGELHFETTRQEAVLLLLVDAEENAAIGRFYTFGPAVLNGHFEVFVLFFRRDVTEGQALAIENAVVVEAENLGAFRVRFGEVELQIVEVFRFEQIDRLGLLGEHLRATAKDQ